MLRWLNNGPVFVLDYIGNLVAHDIAVEFDVGGAFFVVAPVLQRANADAPPGAQFLFVHHDWDRKVGHELLHVVKKFGAIDRINRGRCCLHVIFQRGDSVAEVARKSSLKISAQMRRVAEEMIDLSTHPHGEMRKPGPFGPGDGQALIVVKINAFGGATPQSALSFSELVCPHQDLCS